MSQNTVKLPDEDYYYGFLAEFLDGELTPSEVLRFQDVQGKVASPETPERFRQNRGMLQLKLQSISLNNKQRIMLQNKIRNQQVTETIEANKIDEVAHTVASSNIRRSIGLLILGACLCYIGYYLFSPPQKKVFKPLDALSYEALAMDEDTTGSRLSLPSNDLQEINQFLAKTPGITFAPQVFASLPAGWKADGASVIDYEIAKIAAAQYSNASNDQKVILFSLAGSLDSLPTAETIPHPNGIILRPYASDRLNLIAWQPDRNTLAILAGRPSIRDLVGLVSNIARKK